MKIKILFICFLFISFFACNDKGKRPRISVENNLKDTIKPEIKSDAIKLAADSTKTIELKYSLEQLDNTKGLSNSSANTIFQDSENLIWIGTWDGLNRYDGNTFKIFRPELNNENSLSNQVILKIDEDNLGKIWILTMHGINQYDKKTDVFKRFYFSRKNTPPLSESEFNIALDNSKKVFCAVKDWGIGYYNNTDFELLKFTSLPKKAVKKMQFNSNGDLMVLFEDEQLYSLSIANRNKTEKKITKLELISENIRTFETISNEKICIITTSGNTIIYSVSDKKNQILIENNIDDFIGKIPEGLVASGKSGYSIIDSTGTVINKSWLKHLKNQKITTLIQGSENVIWTGTDGDGIFKMFPLKKSFNLISKSQIPELDGGIIRAFLEIEDNSFWVGTKGKGLFRLPSNFYKNEQPLKYSNFNENNSAINNAVFSLCKGQNELIFIGTDGNGITVYDLKSSKLISWPEIIGSVKCDYFKSIYSIYQDEKGFIWLGTNGYGMIRCKIERSGNKLKLTQYKKYIADNEDGKSLSSNIIFSIVPKNQSQLWIGTRLGGLNLFEKESGLFRTYKNKKDDPQSLSNNDILSLKKDAKNRLWIGTSFGLNLLEDLKSDGNAIFKSFTVKEGLPNNTIHGIVSDKKSNLWISTNFGLSNFILEQSKFINYTKNEGLQNNEFADGAFYQDPKSDYIFMGGIKGFNYFLPQKIKESAVIPDLLIDKISGQNQIDPYYQGLVISPDSETAPAIILDHDQNFFDIELSALTYINSEKCQYAYQLENFDKDWNNINNRRNISFTNVPRGKYSLWMKWTNSDGVWSDPVHAIDIRIKPVFWQSNFAVFIYSILFFFFILFVVSYYKKRQSLNQNILFRQREEELHENRLSFFTNIAHEFLTPLTLIVGPIQRLAETNNLSEKNKKFIQMIERNSSRLLFLTQQLLEFRKAEFDYLEVVVKKFDLVNLVEQIAELFDEWALAKNIEYKLEVPSKLNGWFDKEKIEKIIFNLMSNAFKYTPKNGKINLKIAVDKTNSKKLIITVVNTGKGIPQEKLDSLFDKFLLTDTNSSSDNDLFRTGIGLAFIKKLVTVLKGEVQVLSIPNETTTFTILIPCNKKAFIEKEFEMDVPLDTTQVFISQHLKSILEEIPSKTDLVPEKISTLDSVIDHRKTILIVEDEKEIHSFLNELLSEKYKISIAYNGLEALANIKSEIPDIIISDVMMPLMDGIELCKEIKKDIQTCHIPFIMLTAKESVLHRIEGIESGANSYIPKPFHPDHLLIRIQKLLEEKELILKYFAQDSLVENLATLSIEKEEKKFIKKIINIIRNNIDNENLQSLFIEKELGISNSQLYRKTKQIFSLTPGDLIRTIRLKHAAELLRKNVLTVSEICYLSGFNNRSYFYREFKKMYDLTPKNYQLKYK